MQTYHYRDILNTKEILFTTDANNILEADEIAKTAGFNPMRMICSIGFKLVLFQGCVAKRLWKEEVFKVPAKYKDGVLVEESKYVRNFPGYYYDHKKIIYSGNSKLQIVQENERFFKHKIWENPTFMWQTPDGVHTHDKGQIKALLQVIEESRKTK
jgi:hypothetical protein